MRRLLFIVAAWFCGGIAVAQVSVYSPRAEATSVTIYRDGVALITETRTVELPAEPVTVVFQAVVDSILPQSAVMTGAERPFASTDFNFDLLTPATLIQRSIGKTVTLVRTDKKTGRATRTQAQVVSADHGVVLQAVDGSEALHCAGTSEYLELSEIPSGLNTTPVLSARLAGGAPGRREIKLSYLVHGFSWSSDYVGRLNDAANRMSLTGWVTLENHTNSSFNQAQVQVVAGRLNLISDEGGSAIATEVDIAAEQESEARRAVSLLSECFPLGTTTSMLPTGERRRRVQIEGREAYSPMAMNSPMAFSEVTVTGSRIIRENLADYQLYRLPEPTDLSAHQTKQVVFLTKPTVKVERFYSVRVPDLVGTVYPEGVPNLMLRWENKEKEGLGEPLPGGVVRVFEPRESDEIFTGEASIQDTPVGLPNELEIARAMNLTSEYTLQKQDADNVGGRTQVTIQVLHQFSNNKDAPVSIEVRHASARGYSTPVVVQSSLRAGKKYGDLAWRFVIPPGGQQSLSYELRATQLP